MKSRCFIFKRVDSSIVYKFNFIGEKNDHSFWKREDKNLWCVYNLESGWCIEDETSTRLGWPSIESDKYLPPEGIWPSEKGSKSFQYELIYSEHGD